MIIALFPNISKPNALDIALQIFLFLKSRGIKVVMEDSNLKLIPAIPLSSIEFNSINFMISLGGDGTILRLIHRIPDFSIPLLGINLGGLGFLADIPLSDVIPSIEDLIAGRYSIQRRMVMEGMLHDRPCFAVNDMVIHRAQNPSLIDFAIYVDGQYLNAFASDGIIISTPGGSTAYSLAAGGPIVSPELDVFILTPICPHTLSNRPIVLMPNQNIEIQYLSSLQPIEISCDGLSLLHMSCQDTFIIFPSAQRLPLVKLPRHDYFSTLREKLGWIGRLRG